MWPRNWATPSCVWNETTEEEILLWSLYFGYNEEQDKAMKRLNPPLDSDLGP